MHEREAHNARVPSCDHVHGQEMGAQLRTPCMASQTENKWQPCFTGAKTLCAQLFGQLLGMVGGMEAHEVSSSMMRYRYTHTLP
jgi:hypothetical protein